VASRGVRRTLIGFAGTCAALIAATFLLSVSTAGHWRAFDEWMVRAFRTAGDLATPVGSRAVQIAVRDATALGGTMPLIVLISIVAIYLFLKQHTRTALAVVGSTLLGVIASQILKAVVDRGRPDIVPQLVPEVSGSFPSGHAMMSAIVYLTLGTMLARLEPDKIVRRYILGVAIGLTMTVGLSRVYLGVHWPSDVLGGWALGALWVVAVSQILDWAVRRTGGA
jgi:undecaprenyl-diphosphatase